MRVGRLYGLYRLKKEWKYVIIRVSNGIVYNCLAYSCKTVYQLHCNEYQQFKTIFHPFLLGIIYVKIVIYLRLKMIAYERSMSLWLKKAEIVVSLDNYHSFDAINLYDRKGQKHDSTKMWRAYPIIYYFYCLLTLVLFLLRICASL